MPSDIRNPSPSCSAPPPERKSCATIRMRSDCRSPRCTQSHEEGTMTTDELRENMRGQIADLRAQREASTDDEEKKAANEAIEAIQNTIRQIDIDAANQLGGKIDALIKDLDAVLDKYPLDAVSAL